MNARQVAETAVGRAVVASQFFELSLTLSFELFRMTTDPEYLALSQGYIDPKRFKNPLKNVLRALAERNNIAPELEAEISSLIDKRHVLIHRWMMERGLALGDTPEGWEEYAELAGAVERESSRISVLLTSYLLKFCDLEWASGNRTEFLAKMQHLFRQSSQSVPEGQGRAA